MKLLVTLITACCLCWPSSAQEAEPSIDDVRNLIGELIDLAELEARHEQLVADLEARHSERIAALEAEIKALRESLIDPIEEPQPQPQTPGFDMKAIDNELSVGQQITVPVNGIAEGGQVFYHVFDTDWRDLARQTVTVKDGKLDLVVPNKTGWRIVQLQYGDKFKAHKTVLVEGPAQAEPTTDRVLPVPALGQAAPLPPLNKIGDRHEIAIAQWNVVNQRQIFGKFHLGVVAHHIDGIDYVAISLDGGAWKKVGEPSISPRTGSEEYWATIDADAKKGWREVRAVAVPKAGTPRNVGTLRLYAGANSELFPEIVLQAGTYKVGQLTNGVGSHDEGWVTIRAAEGVSRDKVIITGNATGGRDRHLRFKGITRKLGQWDEHYGDNDPDAWWWFDDCNIQGNTRSRWIVHHSARQYYTDTNITDMQATFQSAWLLARNVVIERGWEDICRSFGMMVNVTINKLDRGEFASYHPDLFQWYQSDVDNFIAQDVTSLNNVAQGLFSGDIKNSAFVRMKIATKGNYVAVQMQNTTRNVLVKDCMLDGPVLLRQDKGFNIPAGERLVFDGNSIDNKYLPGLLALPGVEVR